ncbi:MAG: DoxX family protein [Aulosira sp. DedVER01a]|nr:DoxX family protein [Aulosira sp. ZfuVER01]
MLRIVAGLMFAMHGSQKLFGIPGNKPTVPLASLTGIGGLIELVCGLAIALGLLASYAAFIASGETLSKMSQNKSDRTWSFPKCDRPSRDYTGPVVEPV